MARPVNPFDRPPGDDEPFDVDDAGSWSDDPADDLADDPADGGAAGPLAAPSLSASYGHLFGGGSTPAAPAEPAPTAVPDPVRTDPAPEAGAPAPATTAAPAAAMTATALLEHEDDEPVGLFARTPFVPGTGPRVHLLPPEVLTVRRVRRAQRRGVLALVGVVALVVAAYALSSGQRTMAREDLASAQQRAVELTAEQARYARAPIVYAQVAETRAALASVMRRDVRWYDYLNDLAVTAPSGLWLTSWQATVADQGTAAATAAVDPSTGLPFTADTLATLSFSGTTSDESAVVAWLRLLGATPGLTGAGATSLTRTAIGDQPVITFDSSASMTDAALSDRYAPRKD